MLPNSVLAAPTPPAAAAAAATAAPSPAVATVNPAAANAATVAARLVPSTRPCRRSVSLTTGSRGVAGSSAACRRSAGMRRAREGWARKLNSDRSIPLLCSSDTAPSSFSASSKTPQLREKSVAPWCSLSIGATPANNSAILSYVPNLPAGVLPLRARGRIAAGFCLAAGRACLQ